ncbi:MAG: RdgB/HAM1 family non-canonical purine NTP pyrophosphatase [Flavobacteriales bacterium]
MKKIVLASNNTHKIKEIQQVLKEVRIITLQEAGFTEEIEETAETFEDNAMLKAVTVFDKIQIPTLADDSGLEVEALNGAPGVLSKRYSNSNTDEDNMVKLLHELEEVQNRSARFRSVLCFFDGKKKHYFEGVVKGIITHKKRGYQGFGYDPVFVPEGYEKTFAELGDKVKNHISHRALAVQKFATFYKSIFFI